MKYYTSNAGLCIVIGTVSYRMSSMITSTS